MKTRWYVYTLVSHTGGLYKSRISTPGTHLVCPEVKRVDIAGVGAVIARSAAIFNLEHRLAVVAHVAAASPFIVPPISPLDLVLARSSISSAHQKSLRFLFCVQSLLVVMRSRV